MKERADEVIEEQHRPPAVTIDQELRRAEAMPGQAGPVISDIAT